ncbi:uncharacterized protein LOC132469216 [Gadus macrocephalus]|uniref:uncharacterized protein LOC132469216 n=1 Tax=Gadus macrocephalus TaxID=80720 RepID=UPI0028CBA917|nr:uncharacterized protein LOC132469216 [Gadus macrocephalus]
MERIPGLRFYFGVFLLNCISMAAQGLNFHCDNDFDRLMTCAFNPPPDDPSCAEYTLNTRVEGSQRYTERNCNLISDPVRTGRCSCSLDINGFNVGDNYTTTLRKAGALVESKYISAYDNIKPKAPILTSVTREKGNYLVAWDTKYNDPSFDLMVWLNYRKEGENGTEVDVSFMESYEILGKSLEPSTEYLVSVQSYSVFYSERSGDLTFTTPVSPTSIAVAVIVSLCVAAFIITSFLYLFCTRLKESWWDSVGDYKNSTLLFMVAGDHKVLMPQKTPLSSVYVEACKEDEFEEKPLDSGGNSLQSTRAESVSSSLGYSQKVSIDLISDVEEAMRMAFPQLSTAPCHIVAHSNNGYNPVAGTSSPSVFENMTYSMSSSGTQGLYAANPPAVLSESFYKPSMLWGGVHNPFPDSQVPIFQLTGQRQPFDPSHMKTDLSYQSWNAESGSSTQSEALQVDLSYSCSPSDTTSSSDLHGFGSSQSGDNLKESLLVREADRSSMMERVSVEDKPSFNVWVSNPSEVSCPSPACSLVSLDDDFQEFQSMMKRPGVLIPTANDSRPRGRPDKLPETPYTGMPQRTIEGASTLTQTTQAAQGILDTQGNKVSLLPADQHKLIMISDYHSV